MILASKKNLLASLLVVSMACSDDDDSTTGNDPGTANNGANVGDSNNSGDTGDTNGETNDGDNSGTNNGTTGSDGNPATGGKPVDAGVDGGSGSNGSGNNGTSGSSDAGAEDLEDGEVIAVTYAANLGAIKQAELALLRAKRANVRELAQTIATERGAAQARQTKLTTELGIIPRESTDSEKISQQAGMLHGGLEVADPEAFDAAFVDAQVTFNQAILSILAQKLIPSADQAKIIEELQTLRTSVESHLRQAQELKQTMGSTDGG